ncbi:MAG: hypothetical protein CK424_07115 [Legionella sp.]|nr:MAG: hypothetical protein CK424_07115 [Legionella sp.]
MRLKPQIEVQRDLLSRNQASMLNLRYRLWHTYAEATRPNAEYVFRNDPIHAEITEALRVIEDIQAWHPTWLSSYIDFDKDMYIACTNKSKMLVDSLRAYQQTKEADSSLTALQYREALADLKMLYELAVQKNDLNYGSRRLLALSAAMMLGLYLTFPTLIMPAVVAALFLIPIFLLIVLSLALTGGVDFSFAPGMLSLMNLAVFFALSIGIIGMTMNIMNPSPQGSLRLATALDNLILACKKHCPVPEIIDDTASDSASISSDSSSMTY